MRVSIPIKEGLPEGHKDCLYTKVTIRFDWKDRLRVLLRGRAEVKVRTYCENVPGKVYSEAETTVHAIFPQRAKHCLQAEQGSVAPDAPILKAVGDWEE